MHGLKWRHCFEKVWAIQCYLATENNWIGIWVRSCEERRSKCEMVQFCASENCWWIKLMAEVADIPIMCFTIALIFSCLCNLISFYFTWQIGGCFHFSSVHQTVVLWSLLFSQLAQSRCFLLHTNGLTVVSKRRASGEQNVAAIQ